jgi:hypothetical protein
MADLQRFFRGNDLWRRKNGSGIVFVHSLLLGHMLRHFLLYCRLRLFCWFFRGEARVLFQQIKHTAYDEYCGDEGDCEWSPAPFFKPSVSG